MELFPALEDRPEHPALVAGDRVLTYARLRAAASDLAARVAGHAAGGGLGGPGSGRPVSG